jgi:ribosomal protein S27AE
MLLGEVIETAVKEAYEEEDAGGTRDCCTTPRETGDFFVSEWLGWIRVFQMATDIKCSECGKSFPSNNQPADRWECPHCGFQSWDDPNWRNHRGETRQEEYENNLRFLESGGKITGGEGVGSCLGNLMGCLAPIIGIGGGFLLLKSCF